MSPARIVGLIALAVGVVLLIMGINAANSVTEQASEALTGRFTEATTWYIVGGIAALVGGLALTIFGGARTTSDRRL